jgi:hypothetical protein
MKLFRILASVVVIACLSATAVFAAPAVLDSQNANQKLQKSDTLNMGKKDFKNREIFKQDPIKALESKREKVQTLLKEGKITKEKADAINTRIDSKIKEIQEFNKLTIQQKKDKMTTNFKTMIEKRVKDGKITKVKADEMIQKFTKKIEKWDGKGYPQFHKKGMKFKKHDNTND